MLLNRNWLIALLLAGCSYISGLPITPTSTLPSNVSGAIEFNDPSLGYVLEQDLFEMCGITPTYYQLRRYYTQEDGPNGKVYSHIAFVRVSNSGDFAEYLLSVDLGGSEGNVTIPDGSVICKVPVHGPYRK